MESAFSIASRIRKKKVKSYEVMITFIERINEINDVLNCVVDNRFDEALEEAKKVDELIASGTKTEEELEAETPLLGVPFTTKDSIAVKGLLHTAGVYARRNIRAEKDSDAVALLRAAGGIPLALTNVPELCFWWESHNTVHGKTNNPYDTNRMVAGSSGGEACLQTAAGSPLGIGSDLGGSIRLPACFNGIFGHKPSAGITPLEGMHPVVAPSQRFANTIGPMSRYSRDLLPTLKILTKNCKTDLKLDEPVDLKKLKYYYMEEASSSYVTPVDNEIKKAIKKIAQHMERTHKATVESVNITRLRKAIPIWLAAMTTESGPSLGSALANNQGKINIYRELIKALLGFSRHTVCTLLMGVMEDLAPPYGSLPHQALMNELAELSKEFQDLLGSDGVFIYPTQPTPALYHYETIVKPFNFAYTGIFNVLGLPATHCPMGLNKDGLPIGIQVIAGRNQDRLTIAVARELEKAFNGWVPPPTMPNMIIKNTTILNPKDLK